MDDPKTPEELEEIERVRQLILQRRNRFIAAALAGIGAASESCQTTAAPSPCLKIVVPAGGQSGPRVCLSIAPIGGRVSNGPGSGAAGVVAPPRAPGTGGAGSGGAGSGGAGSGGAGGGGAGGQAGASGASAGSGGEAGAAGSGGASGASAGSGGEVRPTVCLSMPLEPCAMPGKPPPCVCLSAPVQIPADDAGTRDGGS